MTDSQSVMLFTFHVNDVPGLVVSEVGGQMLHSLLLVAPGEHVSGATTVSSGVAHLEVCLLSESVRDALILEESHSQAHFGRRLITYCSEIL